MNWREHFLFLKVKKPWYEVLDFLKNAIAEDSGDEKLYIEAIYFLLDLLLYAKYASVEEANKIAEELKALFDESYKKFSDRAEYLFFVGYFIALAEWFFGQSDLELSNQMQRKASEMEPENILYRWADKLSENDSSAIGLAKQILHEPEKIKWLKSRGESGEYILGIVTSVANKP